jgi:hypothetical protein
MVVERQVGDIYWYAGCTPPEDAAQWHGPQGRLGYDVLSEAVSNRNKAQR